MEFCQSIQKNTGEKKKVKKTNIKTTKKPFLRCTQQKQ